MIARTQQAPPALLKAKRLLKSPAPALHGQWLSSVSLDLARMADPRFDIWNALHDAEINVLDDEEPNT